MNFDCTDSEKFYELNRILGLKEETTTDEVTSNELTPGENIKLNSAEKFHNIQNTENNQRFKAPAASSSSRIAPIRNQILKRTTTTPYISTERIPQTTNYREYNIDRNDQSTVANELIPSTQLSPVNIAQFFDLTTRKTFNYPSTTFSENSEFTTDYAGNAGSWTGIANDFTTNKYDSNTRIVPDLIENDGKNAEKTKADEVVESIKQLQHFYPTSVADSREKRFLFKIDSVKNRQKLFEMLNQ